MDEKTRQAARHWALAQPVVSAFITSVVRDFSARDDILQETAVAVLESFERYLNGERNDLSKEIAKETAQLKEALRKHLAAVDAQFPVPNTNYDPNQPAAS